MDKPSPVTDLLQQNGFPAEGVLQRGRFLHRLERLLDRLLDADSRLHCRVGNVRDGVLILFTDSTAWATRLRYQVPTLLNTLQQQKPLQGLQKIELRVLPEEKKETINQKVSLSSEAASCISACAEGIDDDRLSQALRQLASHHKEGDD